MPATLIRTSFLALLLSAASVPLAQAQTDWPSQHSFSQHAQVEIVTLSDPGTRHHCRLHALKADTIVCGIGFARKPVVYQRDDIAAIIDPPDHSGEHFFIGCLSVAIAGTVAASILLPPLAAVAIGVPSILFGFASAMGTDGDSDGESLRYQRPNTPLTVTLRTH